MELRHEIFFIFNTTEKYLNLSLSRNTICELCSKWGICKIKAASAAADNGNHKNQFETTKGDKTVDRNGLRAEQQAQPDDHIQKILANNDGGLSHEGSSFNVSPIHPKSEDKQQKHRFIKLARIALFKSKRSPINVKRVEIIESNHIELDMMGSSNLPKNNLNASTDGDSYYNKYNNTCDADRSSHFELSNEQSNISPLMDSKVTTCTEMNGATDADQYENGMFFQKDNIKDNLMDVTVS